MTITKNPVYKKEITVGNRSMKISSALFAFCGLLAVTALYSIYAAMQQIGITSEIHYSRFTAIYPFVSFIAFILLMLMIPALSAGLISGEYEQGLLELILITDISPLDIIIGKISSALTIVMVMAIAALPVQVMVFIYGGTTVMGIACMLLALMAAALQVASVSVFFSALTRKTMPAMFFSYSFVAFMFSGLIFTGSAVDSSLLGFAFIFDPVITYVHVLSEGHPGYTVVGLAVQLIVSALFIYFGARVLGREFHRKKD